VKVDYLKIFCIDETVCTAGEANQGSTIVFENFFIFGKRETDFFNAEFRKQNDK
jgi:hypothetical protein